MTSGYEAAKLHPSKGVILLPSCAAQFMVVLDVAIVNVALPSIQRDLGIGQSILPWIVVAYGLMPRGFLLLGGRMADLVGRRRMLLTGLALFCSASLLAGVAGSAGGPPVGRPGPAGLRGGDGGTGCPVDPRRDLRGRRRTHNRALGIYGAVTGISASAGVIASGLLTAGPAGAGSSSSTFRSAPFSSRWRPSSCPPTLTAAAGANASTSPARSP